MYWEKKWCYDLAKWKILYAGCDFALTFNNINLVEDIKNKTNSAAKESNCSVGDPGLIPGLGRSPGEGIGYPPQYSGLYSLEGHTESDTTGRISLSLFEVSERELLYFKVMYTKHWF